MAGLKGLYTEVATLGKRFQGWYGNYACQRRKTLLIDIYAGSNDERNICWSSSSDPFRRRVSGSVFGGGDEDSQGSGEAQYIPRPFSSRMGAYPEGENRGGIVYGGGNGDKGDIIDSSAQLLMSSCTAVRGGRRPDQGDVYAGGKKTLPPVPLM